MERPVRVRHFIDGEFVDSASGATFRSLNPATQEVVAEVAEGGAEDVDRAVRAARRAFDEGPWPRMAPAERKRILYRVAELIDERREELARLETTDVGKPITEALTKDLPRAAYNFRFFADFAELAHTEAFPRPAEGILTYVLRDPRGVAGLITPWNFPLMLETWKVAPALAFGCTVVLKPAEQSPLTADALARICAEAGVPEGVVNVVHGFGPGSAGEALVAHPGVDLISFTGETATAKAIMANAAPTLKKVSFETGGKSASIVFADADLELTLAGTIDAMYRNQGEVCLAGSRLLVQRPIYEDFVARYVERAEALRVGDPMDPRTQVGPLITREHLDRVLGYVEVGRQEGAKLLTGGRPPDDPALAAGNYLLPTVFADVDNAMRICQEEIFGPVQVCMPFEDEDEAVRIANDSRYGLAGMVWTTSLNTAHRVAQRVRTGTMWVNCFFVRDLRAPYGGVKESGLGREGGAYSLEFFTEAKAVVVKLPP
jgi:aminomuconate-semialdehyde/2-hydroxymuconate-6-semialdehyde dehydrogenase